MLEPELQSDDRIDAEIELHISGPLLREMGACDIGVKIFERNFPNGIDLPNIPTRNFGRAIYVNVRWLALRILNACALKTASKYDRLFGQTLDQLPKHNALTDIRLELAMQYEKLALIYLATLFNDIENYDLEELNHWKKVAQNVARRNL